MKSLAWRIKSFDQVRAMETAELERLLPEYEIEAANLSARIKSGEVGAELAARAGKALGALKVCARWIKRELEHRLISSLAESQMARIRQSAEAKLSASTALPTTTDPLADLKAQNAEQAQRIADLEALVADLLARLRDCVEYVDEEELKHVAAYGEHHHAARLARVREDAKMARAAIARAEGGAA